VRQRLRAMSAAAALMLALTAIAPTANPFVSVTLDAQTKPAAGVRKGYQLFRGYPDRFTFEYPTKEWDQVAGGTSSVLALTQKKREATVVIEYQPLRLALEPSEIDEEFAKLELEPVTTRQPGAANTGLKLVEMGPYKVIVIEYSRKGLQGAETVRQYSIASGKHLYRIVCSAPTASFGKHEPVFSAIVETFKVAGATS
jgi:hypothetical protein